MIFASNTGLLFVLLLAAWVPAFAEGDGTLAAALKQRYKLATATLSPAGESSFEPGTILVVRKEGIVSFGEKDASYATLCPSEIRGGDRAYAQQSGVYEPCAPE